jgi:hypothetical protein
MKDIRYQAVCVRCGKHIGDWALRTPVNKRLCWDHKEFNIKDETKRYLRPVLGLQGTKTPPGKLSKVSGVA